MAETNNLLSVIIPVYNGEAFLAEAVASVWSQGYRPLEIILVNDGSTDGTAHVMAELEADAKAPLRCLSQPNLGPWAAYNRGLEAAQGDLLAFLDADDIWPPESLERRFASLHSDPSLDVVLGRLRFLYGKSDGDAPGYELSPETFASPALGCALFRRSAFKKVGGMTPGLHYSEDVDWFLRARECGLAMAKIPDVTLLYRQHDSNMTRGKTPVDLRMLQVLKASLDRRRQSGTAAALPPIPTVKESVAEKK